jgi:hypothetical protein
MVTSRENLNNRKDPTFAKKLKSSRRGFSILGFIQKQMANILSLDYQLDCLDYGSEKWQHADLDFETFKQLQVIMWLQYPFCCLQLFPCHNS